MKTIFLNEYGDYEFTKELPKVLPEYKTYRIGEFEPAGHLENEGECIAVKETKGTIVTYTNVRTLKTPRGYVACQIMAREIEWR